MTAALKTNFLSFGLSILSSLLDPDPGLQVSTASCVVMRVQKTTTNTHTQKKQTTTTTTTTTKLGSGMHYLSKIDDSSSGDPRTEKART